MSRKQPHCCGWGKPHREIPRLSEVKGSECGSCKTSARTQREDSRHRPTCRSKISVGRSLCRTDGPGREVESRRPRRLIVNTTTTPANNTHRNSPPQLVAEEPEEPKETDNSQKARSQNHRSNSQQPLNGLPGSLKRKQPRVSNPRPPRPQNQTGVPTQSPTCTFEEISDLVDHLPLHACVELTRHLLMSICSLPTGPVLPRTALKTVSFCSRIRQHALGGQSIVNHCTSPAEMRTECEAGSLNWSIFSTTKVLIFVS